MIFIISILAATTAGFASDFGAFLFDHAGNSWAWHLPFAHIDLTPYRLKIGPVDMGLSLHVIMVLGAFLGCLLLIPFITSRRNTLPTSRFNHVIEAMVLFLRDSIAIPYLGKKHARTWLPYVCTLFVFLLVVNLTGLIPFMSAASSNINFTAGMAIFTFFVFNIAGIASNSLTGYFKHLVPSGVPGLILLILYPIELIGLFTKVFALSVRMFANLSAGHFVIFAFLGMMALFKTLFAAPFAIGAAVFMWGLELLVAFLQAYVFTLLSTLFIGSAIQQDH